MAKKKPKATAAPVAEAPPRRVKCQILTYVYSDGTTGEGHTVCGGGGAGEEQGKARVGQPPNAFWCSTPLFRTEEVPHPGTGEPIRRYVRDAQGDPVVVAMAYPARRNLLGEVKPYDGVVLVEVRGAGSHETEGEG